MSNRMRFDVDACVGMLRDNSRGFQKSKAEYSSIRELRYTDLKCTSRDMGVLGAVLKNTSEYINRVVRGGHSGLASPVFIIDYDLRANLLKAAEYAIECVNLSFRVEWKVIDVNVELYIGRASDVILTHELTPVLRDGRARDLTKFACATGLGMREVRDDNSTRMPLLLKVFQSGAGGQNKLTRLVKGCLMYLDRLENGPVTIAHAELSTLQYNVESLISTLEMENTAFVYTKHDLSPSHNLILFSMCQAYPSLYLGGADHVHVPADGRYVVLVGSNPLRYCEDTYVSAELIIGTLIEYADQFCLGKDLETAMAIACSLRQNRYLEVVGLPAVLSTCDLIAPALGRMEAGVTEKTLLSHGAATMIGRFHQMACLVLVKDLMISVRNNTRNTYFLYDSLRDVLSRDKFTLLEYMEDKTFSGILKATIDMMWLPYLDDSAFERFEGISIFEGFWVVNNPLTALKDGAIKCLKKGVKNAISLHQPGLFMDSFDTLYSEVVLGGGDRNFSIPNGAYTISVSTIRCLRRPPPVDNFEYEMDVDLTVPCSEVRAPPAPKRSHSGVYAGWECGSDSEDDDMPVEVEVPRFALLPTPRAPPSARIEPPNMFTLYGGVESNPNLVEPGETDLEEEVLVEGETQAAKEGHPEDLVVDVAPIQLNSEQVDRTETQLPVGRWSDVDGCCEGLENRLGEDKEAGNSLPPLPRIDEAFIDCSQTVELNSALATVPGTLNLRPIRPLQRSGADVVANRVRFNDGTSKVTRPGLGSILPTPNLTRKNDKSKSDYGRAITQKKTKLTNDDFNFIDEMKVSEFVNYACEMTKELMELRDYLLCLPQYTYAGDKVWKFRTPGAHREVLMKCVEVWNTHKQGALNKFSEGWRMTIAAVRESNLARVQNYEWPKATDEEIAALKKPMLKEALMREEDFAMPPGKNLSDLRGINKFCGAFDWWSAEATRVCKLDPVTEVLNESDKSWMADYLDKGGNLAAFGEIWRMVRQHALFKAMNWHAVSNRMKDIIKSHRKKNLKVKYRARTKEESIANLCRTDSFIADKMSRHVTKEEYNDAVYRLMSVSESKIGLLLHQLYITETMITRPVYYVIAYRSTDQDHAMGYRLGVILKDYID